ncbi:partial Serine/threonine-protein kinase Pkn1, partial [Anaerolineae bacterium]
FVDDGGYTEKWKVCWTDAGWAWREKNNAEMSKYLDDLRFGITNHPVVAVSWYESVAYCNWLNQTNPGRAFRLPTEAEWERAARHTDGREYPWGGKFDSEKANTDESKIGQTTAVGLFPRGASECGALDMSGNVWEWCSSERRDYPYRADDGRENLASTGTERPRVLRGGSWVSNEDDARCAFRDYSLPDDRNDGIGFRVAESSSAPGSEF